MRKAFLPEVGVGPEDNPPYGEVRNATAVVESDRPRRPRRLHSGAPHAVATLPMFMVFDLLHRDGRELTGPAPRPARLLSRTSSPNNGGRFGCVHPMV